MMSKEASGGRCAGKTVRRLERLVSALWSTLRSYVTVEHSGPQRWNVAATMYLEMSVPARGAGWRVQYVREARRGAAQLGEARRGEAR